jgi:5-methylcytosine-specific restriction endonuclease McrA
MNAHLSPRGFIRIAHSPPALAVIFNKTNGKCVYCGASLQLANYGACSQKNPPLGAWEVDHWIPRSWFTPENAGDFDENYEPVCCSCNDDKLNRLDGAEYLNERLSNDLPYNQDTALNYLLMKNVHPSWIIVMNSGLRVVHP